MYGLSSSVIVDDSISTLLDINESSIPSTSPAVPEWDLAAASGTSKNNIAATDESDLIIAGQQQTMQAEQDCTGRWGGGGWWWFNPWSYWGPSHVINYFTGVYDAGDRANELDAARRAMDPNRPLQPGDFPTALTGKPQSVAAAEAQSQINQFGRDRIADAAMIAGGQIIIDAKLVDLYRRAENIKKFMNQMPKGSEWWWKAYENLQEVYKQIRNYPR
jgi:hypothetical protein